jgi:hypothetical protein
MLVMPDAAWDYGFALRRAVAEPPKLVVVLGIWLHFFPGFLISALVLFLTFIGGGEEGILGLLWRAPADNFWFRVWQYALPSHAELLYDATKTID